MTETRIRWQDDHDSETGAAVGYVGAVASYVFKIWPPEDDDAEEWMLATALPGMAFKRADDADPEKLKAEAERWLEEFVASLGAIFPDQFCLTACQQGARETIAEREIEARHDAGMPEHNYEYGREHGGYSHMGIPPACPACRREEAAKAAGEKEQSA